MPIAQREISTLGTPLGDPSSGLAAPGGGGGGGGGGLRAKKEFSLFNGIRVRMGITTGLLPPGSMCKGSAVLDLAKSESQGGNGVWGGKWLQGKTNIGNRMQAGESGVGTGGFHACLP